MENPASGRRKIAFLVNFWYEPEESTTARDAWRGSVEHIASGKRLYFNDISSLVGFLSTWLGRRDAP